MDNNVIEKGILARKIREHFSKNPKAASVIIKSSNANGKKFYRVTKEGKKNFNITEINTSKETYSLEMKIPKKKKTLKEASSQFANISRIFSDAIVTMDHARLSQAMNQIAPLISQLQDPVEKDQAGKISGVLTNAVNSTTKAGQTQQVSMQKTIQAPGQLTTSKSTKGKVVKEDEDPLKKKDPSSIEPEDPDDENGIESASDEQESEEQEDLTAASKTEEETLFIETLKGQTIKAGDLQLDVNGGILTLQLISVAAPLELEWHNNGKVIFRHKGRPYILKK